MTRPLTLIRRTLAGETDDYGNEQHSESTLSVLGELQQRQRSEPAGEEELSATEWDLFLPAGTEIDANDVVEVDGERFEVIGAAWAVRNPRTGVVSHVQVTLRRTAGAEDAA